MGPGEAGRKESSVPRCFSACRMALKLPLDEGSPVAASMTPFPDSSLSLAQSPVGFPAQIWISLLPGVSLFGTTCA